MSTGSEKVARGLQSPKTFVIPAQAGIQTEDFDPVSLDPRFRGGDEKNDFAILVGYVLTEWQFENKMEKSRERLPIFKQHLTSCHPFHHRCRFGYVQITVQGQKNYALALYPFSFLP